MKIINLIYDRFVEWDFFNRGERFIRQFILQFIREQYKQKEPPLFITPKEILRKGFMPDKSILVLINPQRYDEYPKMLRLLQQNGNPLWAKVEYLFIISNSPVQLDICSKLQCDVYLLYIALNKISKEHYIAWIPEEEAIEKILNGEPF